MPWTPASSTAARTSVTVKGWTIAVISFMASDLRAFRVQSPADERLVRVGLLLVHADVALDQNLFGRAQFHEQAEELQDGAR